LYLEQKQTVEKGEGAMRKLVYSLFIAVLIVVLLAGCATIVSKSDYPVTITSNPDGANIRVTNGAGESVFSGQTPATVTLKAGAGFFKGEDYTVTFEKEGYNAHTAQIQRGVDGWYIGGNLLFGGLIGWLIVDPATGAMWTLSNLHADLTSATSSISEDGVHIVTINQVPEDLRSEMVRLDSR
jgi:hypothetical protein